MAYFKICVRAKRKDNTYPVYIRVTHHGQVGYIKTGYVLSFQIGKAHV